MGAAGINNEVIINPQLHYKNDEKSSVYVNKPIDPSMHGSLKALSEKSLKDLGPKNNDH